MMHNKITASIMSAVLAASLMPVPAFAQTTAAQPAGSGPHILKTQPVRHTYDQYIESHPIEDGESPIEPSNKLSKSPQAIKAQSAVMKKYSGKGVVKNKKLVKNRTINLAQLASATAETEVTYEKANQAGGAKVSVNRKKGTVTVKKGLKKGAYPVKVKLSAAETDRYAAATKTITLKITVG